MSSSGIFDNYADAQFWSGGLTKRVQRFLNSASSYEALIEDSGGIDNCQDMKVRNAKVSDAPFFKAQREADLHVLPEEDLSHVRVWKNEDTGEVHAAVFDQLQQQKQQQPPSQQQPQPQQQKKTAKASNTPPPSPSQQPLSSLPSRVTVPIPDHLKEYAGIKEITYNPDRKYIFVKDADGAHKRSFVMPLDPARAVNRANFESFALKKNWDKDAASEMSRYLFFFDEEKANQQQQHP